MVIGHSILVLEEADVDNAVVLKVSVTECWRDPTVVKMKVNITECQSARSRFAEVGAEQQSERTRFVEVGAEQQSERS